MASPALPRTHPRSPLRRVFGRRVFVVSYLAEAQSILGDQLARVALSVIVFQQTGSAPATAATYAATFLPAVIGGFLLGHIGDRVDRRAVMVGCDLFRAACFAVMTVWVGNVALLVALLILAVAASPVFTASQLAMLSSHLGVDEFVAGNGARLIVSQAAQVGGFAIGGVVAGFLGPRYALLINAATFLVSAGLLHALLPGSPRGHRSGTSGAKPMKLSDLDAVVRRGIAWMKARPRHRAEVAWWRADDVRPLVYVSMCIGFFVVPEGLAVVVADALDAGAAAGGVLLASGALGGALGAWMLASVGSELRRRIARVSSMLCGLPLVLGAFLAAWHHSYWLIAVCWMVSGAAGSYIVQTTGEVIKAVPDASRSRAIGRLSSVLLAVQGLAIVGFSLLADYVAATTAVGIAGAAGFACAVLATRGWRKATL